MGGNEIKSMFAEAGFKLKKELFILVNDGRKNDGRR